MSHSSGSRRVVVGGHRARHTIDDRVSLMTRLEDALAKLQSRAATVDERLRPGLGTVREASKLPTPKNYGGRFIQVDLAKLRARNLLAPDSADRRLIEEYRAI